MSGYCQFTTVLLFLTLTTVGCCMEAAADAATLLASSCQRQVSERSSYILCINMPSLPETGAVCKISLLDIISSLSNEDILSWGGGGGEAGGWRCFNR